MKILQFREAIREAMEEEMQRDDRVFLIGEEVAQYNGAYKVSKGMLEKFGAKRVIDTPISELGFAGIAIGAAMNGLRPIVEFMTFNFSFVAFDQIINNAAKIMTMSGGQFNIPIVFRGPDGHAGQLAATHSQEVSAIYSHIPGLKVVVPSNPADAKGLLKSAIRDDDPVLVLESELMYGDKGEVPESEYLMPIGKAKIVNKGDDLTIVSFGKMMKIVNNAYEILKKEGINAEIIDLMSTRPIDYNTIINSVKKTNRLLIVEEAWPLGNISSEIAYKVQKDAFDYLDAPVRRLSGADAPLMYSKVLVDAYLPSTEKIIKTAKEIMYLL